MENVIRVYAKLMKNEKGTYYNCSTVLKDGYYKVKFKCNIKFPGNKSGFFLVKVDLKDMSPDTKIKTDKNGQSYEEKILWINDIIGIKEDTEYYALLREKKEQELLKLLDDSLKF